METEPDESEVWRSYQPAASGARPLLIVFSAHYPDEPRPSFEFKRSLAELPVHILRVRDSQRAWYLRGLRGLAPDLQATVEFFQTERRRLGADRLYTLGSSMGGYAALLFGHLLEADVAVAFSPQLLLGAEARARVGCNTYKYEPELAALERWAGPAGLGAYLSIPDLLPLATREVQVHVGQNEEEDIAQAAELQHAVGASLRMIVWPGGNHLIAKQLRDAGKLIPLLHRAFPCDPPESGPEYPVPERKKSPHGAEALARTAAAKTNPLQRRAQKKIAEEAAKAAEQQRQRNDALILELEDAHALMGLVAPDGAREWMEEQIRDYFNSDGEVLPQ